MQTFQQTYIIRHRKENLKKCSLRGLESRPDLRFFTYPRDPLPPLNGYVLLTLGAEELSLKDGDKGLLFIDGTWALAQKMESFILKNVSIEKRTLPAGIRTAYPRVQTGCLDPDKGLATVEALYAAYLLTGRNPEGLLENYYWKNSFLLTLGQK